MTATTTDITTVIGNEHPDDTVDWFMRSIQEGTL